MQNNFVLPEKWCVERNKNTHVAINKWFNETYQPKQPFAGYGAKGGCKYWHHPKPGIFWSLNTPYHTLITYEQFLLYVVGQSSTTNNLSRLRSYLGTNTVVVCRSRQEWGDIIDMLVAIIGEKCSLDKKIWKDCGEKDGKYGICLEDDTWITCCGYDYAVTIGFSQVDASTILCPEENYQIY